MGLWVLALLLHGPFSAAVCRLYPGTSELKRTSKDLQTKKCDVCTLAGVQGGAVSDLGTAAKAVCLC